MRSWKTGAFGAAGDEIVVEAFLDGEEVSILALVDGANFVLLPSAQDHKAVGDGRYRAEHRRHGRLFARAGGNGGADRADPGRDYRADSGGDGGRRGRPFKGVLYAGLMIGPDGPKVLEFNTRFGDPECQPLMMRLMSDLLPALLAARDGELKEFDLRWYDEPALTVVLAANGYPGAYEKGSEIRGLESLTGDPDTVVFHAGTAADGDRILAASGRVLGVTAMAPTILEAQHKAYAAVDAIDWPEGFCRRDIGWRAVGR